MEWGNSQRGESIFMGGGADPSRHCGIAPSECVQKISK